VTTGRVGRLVPELIVADLAASLRFWCGLVGFRIRYDRPEHGFAYLECRGAEVMLEQHDTAARTWETGPLDRPLGRGINFQIDVDELAPILARLHAAGWALFLAPEEKWYRAGAIEHGQRQFLVQDPDGYLLRLAESLGERPATPAA
jgi:catechol 2,3-dioxygenase-like lactoylglutathione lyase family enzyme